MVLPGDTNSISTVGSMYMVLPGDTNSISTVGSMYMVLPGDTNSSVFLVTASQLLSLLVNRKSHVMLITISLWTHKLVGSW